MAPHAERTSSQHQQQHQQQQEQPQTNGVQGSSKTITHLQSFPLVASLTSTVNSIPLAKRTLSLIHTIVAPLTPYASPYISKADTIADSNLSKIEAHFPIVKESPENLKSIIVSYPYKLIDTGKGYVADGKAYVLQVYSAELDKKAGKEGAGLIPKAKAGVSSAFVVSHEVLTVVAQFLGTKKEELEKKGQVKRDQAARKVEDKKVQAY